MTTISIEAGAEKFLVKVVAGDTEPFEVHRSLVDLQRFSQELGKAYATNDKVDLPDFPDIAELDGGQAAMKAVVPLLQGWVEECLVELPTAAERVVFGRALQVDLGAREERAVPVSLASRAAATAALGAKLAANAAGSAAYNAMGMSGGEDGDLVMSNQNIELIVEHLSTLRGAALKLVQKLNSMRRVMVMNPKLQEALEKRVLSNTVAMPHAQVVEVMKGELGDGWNSKFSFFSPTPFAAASIGQVHTATKGEDQTLAVKVQFPGVQESIASDMKAILTLLDMSFTKGNRAHDSYHSSFTGYADTWVKECDYALEAANLARYRANLVADPTTEPEFECPMPFPELSTGRVLTMAFISGVTVDKLCGSHVAQGVRNDVAERIIRIKFEELFTWRFMNSDPHFGNFLFNTTTRKLGLLDFGCCLEVSEKDSKDLLAFIEACTTGDRDATKAILVRLAAIVDGQDSEAAQAQLIDTNEFLLSPFKSDAVFDFGPWYEDERMKQFKENVDYQTTAWDTVKLPGDTKPRLESLAMTEYLMQLLLHAGRLKAQVAVRKYLLKALGK